MNKRLLWTFCALLVCVLLPTFGANGFDSTKLAVADTVFQPSAIDLGTTGQLQDVTTTNHTVFVSDQTNKCIYAFDTQNNTTSTQQFSNSSIPNRLSFQYANFLVVSSANLNEIVVMNESNTTFGTFLINDTPYTFTAIFDIAQTTDGTIFALVAGNGGNYLVKKPAEDLSFVVVAQLENLSAKSKLAVSLLGDTALVLNNDKIYSVLDGVCVEDEAFKRPTLSNISSILLDHKNELYILCTDGTMVHSTKEAYCTITINNASTITDFCLSPANNTIYFLTPNNLLSLSEVEVDGKSFLNAISTTQNVDINTDTTSSPLQTVVLDANSFIYKYDNMLEKICQVTADTNVTVLDNLEGNEFCFVLDTSSQYNITGYVLKSQTKPQTQTIQASTYKVLYDGTKIYPFPTTLKNSEESNVRSLASLNQGVVFSVTESCVTPTDHNNASFVFATVVQNNQEYSGYIDVHNLCKIDDTQEITNIFVGNAITKNDIDVFVDNQLSTQLANLQKGTQVQIISTNNGISYIQWQIDDTTYFGYTLYTNLDDGSITMHQTIGFFVMLVALVVCLVMLSVIQNQKRKYALDYEK